MEECCQSFSLGNDDYFILFGSKDANQHVVHYFMESTVRVNWHGAVSLYCLNQ